jgi:hypothetical protein
VLALAAHLTAQLCLGCRTIALTCTWTPVLQVACILKSIIAQQTLKSVIECLGLDSALKGQHSDNHHRLRYAATSHGGGSGATELSMRRLNIVVQASDVRQPLVVPT